MLMAQRPGPHSRNQPRGLGGVLCPLWHHLENEQLKFSLEILSLAKVLQESRTLCFGFGMGRLSQGAAEFPQKRSGREEFGLFSFQLFLMNVFGAGLSVAMERDSRSAAPWRPAVETEAASGVGGYWEGGESGGWEGQAGWQQIPTQEEAQNQQIFEQRWLQVELGETDNGIFAVHQTSPTPPLSIGDFCARLLGRE